MFLDHIAIAVDDLAEASALFSKFLGLEFSPPVMVESQKTLASFAQLGSCQLELIEATSENSPMFPILPHPIKTFVEKHGWGLHHIAFNVSDLEGTLQVMREKGFDSLGGQISNGAHSQICFINPQRTGGVLIELCQD